MTITAPTLSGPIAGRKALLGALLFLFPLVCLVTLPGVSLASFAFLLAAPFVLRSGGAGLARHWRSVRWVLFAFLLNFLVALAGLALHRVAPASSLEKPARMLFSATALVLVLGVKPDRRALWWGVIGGALAGAVLVGYQRFGLGMDRPGGLINAITFGDLSLCLGLVAMAAALDFRRAQMIWPAIGALAGLAGSVMTGTRGGWISLALAGVVFFNYSHALAGRAVRALVVVGFALVASTYFIPEAGVHQRAAEGVHDVATYFAGGSAFSNVGIRLELWKGASMLVRDHPWAGIDGTTVQAAMASYAARGELDPVAVTAPHMHNDALQALVTGGVAGFAAWLAMLIAPGIFFARALRERGAGGERAFAPALAGLLVVVGYFGFGLTEVIFWTVKASLFYSLMVFLLMGFCLAAKENDGK